MSFFLSGCLSCLHPVFLRCCLSQTLEIKISLWNFDNSLDYLTGGGLVPGKLNWLLPHDNGSFSPPPSPYHSLFFKLISLAWTSDSCCVIVFFFSTLERTNSNEFCLGGGTLVVAFSIASLRFGYESSHLEPNQKQKYCFALCLFCIGFRSRTRHKVVSF